MADVLRQKQREPSFIHRFPSRDKPSPLPARSGGAYFSDNALLGAGVCLTGPEDSKLSMSLMKMWPADAG